MNQANAPLTAPAGRCALPRRTWAARAPGRLAKGQPTWVGEDLQIDPVGNAPIDVRLLQFSIAPISLNFVESRFPQTASREAPALRSRTARRFDLIYVIEGCLAFAHCDRAFELGPNTCAIIDTAHRLEFESFGRVSSMSVQIPEAQMRRWVAQPERAVARVLTSGRPWDRILIELLRSLSPSALADLPFEPELILDQLGSALAIVVGQHDTDGRCADSRLRRIHATLRRQCHEVTFDLASLAAATGLSKRTVQGLLAADGTTFSKQLLMQRLERAKASLADRKLAALSIADIAWDCGFADPFYFSRCFRRAYGVAPRNARS